jgi:glycosyltransferase involved in cell wall biosynthesis
MTKMLKVLMVVENIPVPGDPRVWAEATTLRDAGMLVSIICPKGQTQQESYICLEGIHIYRYRLPVQGTSIKGYCTEYGIALLMTFWLCWKVLVRRGFDVIHTANPPDFFFAIGLFYRLLGKKFVFDQHDPAPELFLAKFKGQSRRSTRLQQLLFLLERCSYRTAQIVITSNQSQMRFALERGRIPAHKIFVVRNGPNLQRMRHVAYDPALKMGKRYLLAYMGVMGKQDGVEYTLYALHYLVHKECRKDVSLILIGDGDRRPALYNLARDLRIENYVNFVGWVAPEDIPRYLSAADIGLVPDPQNGLNEFCTMIKTMDYMALGMPVVAFDLVETRFSAQDAALYAIPNRVEDFAEKIAMLLDDEETQRRMGTIGQKRVREELSWEQSKEHLLTAYRKLFGALSVPSRTLKTSNIYPGLLCKPDNVPFNHTEEIETLKQKNTLKQSN